MDADQKREVINRLRSIQGHIKGIERMVEEDQYCIDIINQTQAVSRALERVNALILGSHLNSCVTTAIRGDDTQERERVLGELMQVFQHSSKL